MDFQTFVEKFPEQGRKRAGAGYNVRCPSHLPDSNASLTITPSKDGKILIKCRAGCSTEAVLSALGITFSDLFTTGTNGNGHAKKEIVATYDYKDLNGVLLYQAVRYVPKDFRLRRPDANGGWIYKDVLKGFSLVPYRLAALSAKIAEGKWVFIVEGEKDCDSLARLDVCATTNVTGAGNWTGRGYDQFFSGANVCIIPDNDNAGRKHAEEVARSLDAAREIRILELPEVAKKGDVTDWLEAGGTKDKLAVLLSSAQPWRNGFWPEELTRVENVTIVKSSKLVLKKEEKRVEIRSYSDDCPIALSDYNRTDDGNGRIIEHLFSDRLRYNHTTQSWIVWNGKRWLTDEKREAERLALDAARQRGQFAANRTDLHAATRDAIFKWSLRSESQAGVQSALAAACRQPKIATTAKDWDRDLWLLGCQNGVIDLNTGEFLAPDPDRLISKSVAVNYEPDAYSPAWEKAIHEIFAGECDMIEFVQRALGYALTGSTREHCCFILHGNLGRNGKSTIIENCKKLMGDYGLKSQFTTFLQQHNNQAGGARDDIANLAGKRIVIAIESGKKAKIDEATIKELTGGDSLSARHLYGRGFQFDPEFKVFLASNYKPEIRDVDNAIWSRIRLIPFEVSFEGREDKALWTRLESEFSGILNWMIDGCVQWLKIGLEPPEKVTGATKNYRLDCDPLGKFISENCVVGDFIYQPVAPFAQAFNETRKEEGEKEWSNKSIKMSLMERGYKQKKMNMGLVWLGFELVQ